MKVSLAMGTIWGRAQLIQRAQDEAPKSSRPSGTNTMHIGSMDDLRAFLGGGLK